MRNSLHLIFYNILFQEHYDNFFEDCFVEAEEKYGEVEEMNVCDNLGDHLVGNVYVKFRREEDAERAVNELNNRWFGGRPIYAELSPVTDFREVSLHDIKCGLSDDIKILNKSIVLKNTFSTYIRPVVVNMRWVNVFVQDFAISCI